MGFIRIKWKNKTSFLFDKKTIHFLILLQSFNVSGANGYKETKHVPKLKLHQKTTNDIVDKQNLDVF